MIAKKIHRRFFPVLLRATTALGFVANAAAEGRWRVMLAAENASAESSELTVTGANTVRVHDVLVGDVWLCGGQSNMEFRFTQVNNAEAEIAAANFPFIRHFKIPHTVADAPADSCVGQWTICSPATAGDFTAIGFCFAREMSQRLGVPIGLVNSNWGRTQIESWMSDATLKADPAATEIFARWQNVLADYPAKVAAHGKAVAKWEHDAAAEKSVGQPFTRRKPTVPEGPGSRWQPAGMYHAMIAPLEPAALRGVLWYQGEANVARIEGDSLLVSAGVVPNPVAVRYAWRNAPPATLFNLAGLPAAPFRSDTW